MKMLIRLYSISIKKTKKINYQKLETISPLSITIYNNNLNNNNKKEIGKLKDNKS